MIKRYLTSALLVFALLWAPIATAQNVSNRRLDLILNDTATTQSRSDTYWEGGRGIFMVESSSWGGGNVQLQYQSPNGTWILIGVDGTLTANGMIGFELPPGYLRAVRTTATGVYAYVFGSLIQ